MHNKVSKTVSCISSGGARGLAHVGVIRALQHHGFRVGAVAGTSMGALVGGIFASGHLDAFQTWAKTLDKMEVLKMTDFSISTKGLVKGDRIIRKLKEIVPQRRIEELELPFVAVATDILNVVRRWCSGEGDLFEAIRCLHFHSHCF
jgi:NTE family protein